MRKETKTIAVMVAVFALCLLLVDTASAGSLSVSPTTIEVSKVFDKPKDTTPSFTTSASFTVKNNVNKTVSYSVSYIPTESGITISPSPPSGTIAPYGSAPVSLTITLSSSLSEGEHTGKVKVQGDGESHTVVIPISITHNAKLEVSPTSVSFDKIGTTGSTSKTVTFKETLGYKSIVVNLKRTGNDWVTASSNSFTLSEGGSKTITFSFKPRGVTRDNCDRHHTWKYSVTSTEGAGTYTINLKGEICCPAKLSYDSRSSTTITFNRPKTEHRTFHATAMIRVGNTGCEQMKLKSPGVTSPSGSVSLSVKNYPTYIYGYGSGYIEIGVSAPYDTPEGTYKGSVSIDAGNAGSGSADVLVTVKHGVELYVTPTNIDFGDVEILKEVSKTVTLKENLGYKTVSNIVISKDSGPKWISVQPSSIYGITAGKSDSAILTLKFQGDAIPGNTYKWSYVVTSDAPKVTIQLLATATIIDLSKILNDLEGMKNTGVAKKYSSVGGIIDNSINMLNSAKDAGNLAADDWGSIALIATQSQTLLRSLDSATEHLDKNDHDNAFEEIVVASTSSKSIESNSRKIAHSTVKSHAKEVSTAAEGLVSNLLNSEVSYFTDTAQTARETNYLEAIKAYRNVATAYGLMQNPSKEREFNKQADALLELHDELIEEANENRVEAEEITLDIKRDKLTRIGGSYALLNPFNYDTVSKSYNLAIAKYAGSIDSYNQAGEMRMSEDAVKHFEELKGGWRGILIGFYGFMLILILVFAFALFRAVKGMTAYQRDSSEERLGDVVIGE